MFSTTPPKEVLSRHFDYDDTEPFAFRWKVRPWRSRVLVGDPAGYWHRVKAQSSVLQRYINVEGRRIAVHRAVWMWHRGEEAPFYLTFKNGDPGDCRIGNLVNRPPTPRTLQTCREDRQESWRAWRAKWTDEEWSTRLKRGRLMRVWGITPEERDALIAAQGGVCAICGGQETMRRNGKDTGLSIDHCHKTKGRRGMLCNNCNNGLGRFKDDPDLLIRAAAYLRRW